LEISTDGGGTWSDLGGFITANGYNGVVSTSYSNPLGGRSAWVSGLAAWTKVEVDLTSFAGQNVQIRWRIGCDSSVSAAGWYIDDVQITSPLPANLAPTLLGISPDHGSANENTPVVITGTNFIPTPALILGETWLISVTQVSTTTLNAVVPAGIPVGTYSLTLYNGDCQLSVLPDAFTVIKGVLPIEGLAAQNSSPTELGQTTFLTATVTAGDQISYSWNFGDDFLGVGANVSHIYSQVGEYTAVVTVTNSVSSAVTNTLVTIVDVPITGLFAVSDSPTQFGDSTTFTATVTAGTNIIFTWDFGDGSAFAYGANAAHTYAEAGEYAVILTASNSSGSQQIPLNVVVTAPPRRPVYLSLIQK
jgi:hypothetical protein